MLLGTEHSGYCSEPSPTLNLNLNQIPASIFHHVSDVQIKEQLTAYF